MGAWGSRPASGGQLPAANPGTAGKSGEPACYACMQAHPLSAARRQLTAGLPGLIALAPGQLGVGDGTPSACHWDAAAAEPPFAPACVPVALPSSASLVYTLMGCSGCMPPSRSCFCSSRSFLRPGGHNPNVCFCVCVCVCACAAHACVCTSYVYLCVVIGWWAGDGCFKARTRRLS